MMQPGRSATESGNGWAMNPALRYASCGLHDKKGRNAAFFGLKHPNQGRLSIAPSFSGGSRSTRLTPKRKANALAT